MAGGGGFVSDMVKSIRNNRNLKQNPYYKGENYAARNPTEQLQVPDASPEVLEQLRLNSKLQERSEKRKTLIALAVSLVIVILIAVIIFSFL